MKKRVEEVGLFSELHYEMRNVFDQLSSWFVCSYFVKCEGNENKESFLSSVISVSFF